MYVGTLSWVLKYFLTRVKLVKLMVRFSCIMVSKHSDKHVHKIYHSHHFSKHSLPHPVIQQLISFTPVIRSAPCPGQTGFYRKAPVRRTSGSGGAMPSDGRGRPVPAVPGTSPSTGTRLTGPFPTSAEGRWRRWGPAEGQRPAGSGWRGARLGGSDEPKNIKKRNEWWRPNQTHAEGT